MAQGDRLSDRARQRGGLPHLRRLPDFEVHPDGRDKLGGIPAGGFWHVVNLCRFEAGELDDWIPGLRLPDDASFFDLPPWIPEVRRPKSLRRAPRG